MKNQNIVFIAIAFALAFALALVTGAEPSPQGGPETAADAPAATAHSTSPEAPDSRLSPSIALTMLPGENRYIRVGRESSKSRSLELL